MMQTMGQWWMWLGFFTFILCMLVGDTLLFNGKGSRPVRVKEALTWTIVWVVLALLFNLVLWGYLRIYASPAVAHDKALQFLTGYLIEKSLSVDNIFVFLMLFDYFAIPRQSQKRVLQYGVFGAIVLRLLLILCGIWLVHKVAWILIVFGGFLLITGIKMLWAAEQKPNLTNHWLLRWLQRHVPLTNQLHGERFIIRQNKQLYFTPLFVVLVLVELSDVIFAVDSIPAIFAITTDPFIVFTSNIFAILGLRALYFVIADMAARFYLLKYGLALILMFVGCKVLLAHWYAIPIGVALAIIAMVLGTCVLLSMWHTRHQH